MKILLCHPGADWAVSDVFTGYYDALKAQGHDVGVYLLSERYGEATDLLLSRWRRSGKDPDTKPGPVQIQYEAGREVILRALYHQPDWVVIVAGFYFHPDLTVMLRRAGQKVAILLTESPYDDAQQAAVIPPANLVFTTERSSPAALRQANPNTYYLPHAYDPLRHWPRPPVGGVVSHDVLFIGTFFKERIELLSAIDWSGIDLGLYGWFDLIPRRSKLRQYLRDGLVDNADAAELYCAAKINLNMYRTSKGYGKKTERIEHAESMNPRGYELAACGAFHLSDPRAEIAETFGDLVPTFRDAKELERLIRAYLPAAALRQSVARRLPAAVEVHTFDARARTLIDHLEAYRRAESAA